MMNAEYVESLEIAAPANAVTDVDDGRRYVTEGGGRGIRYRCTWTVDERGSTRSELTCTFAGIPQTHLARLLVRLFGRLGERPTREAMRADLRDIASAEAIRR